MTLSAIWFIGQFHGVIRPTTPMGSSAIWVVGGMGAKGADPFDLVKGGEEVVQVPRQAGGLRAAGHVDGRAHFHRNGGGEVFDAGLVLFKDADHGGAAVGRGRGGPGGKAALAAATAASVSACAAQER